MASAQPLDCVDPGPFPNGDMTGEFSHGSFVSFDCHTGYTLEGPDAIICDHGVWSEAIAACRGKCHCDFGKIVSEGQGSWTLKQCLQ